MVFEIKPDTNIDFMNASYTAYLDSTQLFTNETATKSIEKFNNSLVSSSYSLIKSEFEAGHVYSIRFNYESEKYK